MSRWPAARHVPVELPAWVRCFVPGDWRDPDEDARWPADTWGWRAACRWCAARNEFLAGNPAAARQACAELVAVMHAPL